MHNIKKYVLPVFIILLTYTLFFIFKTVPVSRLWNGYSTLYVPVNTDSQIVLQKLDEAGCKDVISFYNQRTPFVSEFFPISFFDNTQYLDKRNSYFFDKDKSVMIYYIPDEFNKNANTAIISLINDYSIDAGLDCKSSFPLLMPIICLLILLLFFVFSKQKIVFLLSTFSQIIFIFSMPFYINAASVCIYIYFVFLIQKFWKRKNALTSLTKNYFAIILFLVACISSFFASILSGIFFLLSTISSILILKLYNTYLVQKEQKLRFNPIFIRPAHLIKSITLKEIKKIFVCIIAIFSLLILYVSSTNIFSISNSQDLYFPMPTSYNEHTNIPTLDDYVVWSWNVVTMPFKSLNEEQSSSVADGQVLAIQRFENTQEGVKHKTDVLYEFNSTFKSDAINYIDNLDYPAIEKLMKKQNMDFFVSYSNGASEKFKTSNIIVMIILIILPCTLAIIYLLGCRKDDNII